MDPHAFDAREMRLRLAERGLSTLALRGLARLIFDEYPGELSITEIVQTWAPAEMTAEERDAIKQLDRAGVFDG